MYIFLSTSQNPATVFLGACDPMVGRTFQEQKISSVPFLSLESRHRKWPCAFFHLPIIWAASAWRQPAAVATWRIGPPMRGGRQTLPQDVHLNRG